MRDFAPVWRLVMEDSPLPSGEVDVSPRAAGEGASIELNASALTRAVGASSPEGRGNSVRRLRARSDTLKSDLMKLGHFTAAVLVGWILLAPSIDCARRRLQRETPVSEWEHVDHFASRESCEDF